MPVVPRIALGNQMIFGFPNTILTKLRYADAYTLSSTTGSIAKQVFIWNSTYDPDSTGPGHQPLYRDTYAGIYDHYAVVSASIKVTFQPLTTVTGVHVGALTDDDIVSSTTFNVLCEQNNGKHLLMPPLNGSISNRTITMNWDCKEVLGIDPYTSESYKTAVGTNPTEYSALTVWMTPADGTSSIQCQIYVELVQTVLWTELTTPTTS